MSTRNQENNRRTRHLDTYLDHMIDYFDNNKNSFTTPIVSLNTQMDRKQQTKKFLKTLDTALIKELNGLVAELTYVPRYM